MTATAARYFEDFRVGDRVITGTRPITEVDIGWFAALSGDHNALHSDADFARQGPFGGLIAHGLLGLSVAVGLIEQTGVHDGTTLAMLDVREWQFRRPVFAGDQVSARMTVAATYPSTTDPCRGVIVRHLALLGERGEVLQEGLITLLVRTRAAAR